MLVQRFSKFFRSEWSSAFFRFTGWSVLLLGYYLLCTAFHHAAEVKSVAKSEGLPPGKLPIQVATTASCSGRACHGGTESVPGQVVGQNEYSSWLAHDPHSRAYDALLSERGKTIAKNLGGPEAHQNIRCLACHVTPQLAVAQAKSSHPLDLGVGCESCHGPAAKFGTGVNSWLARHTTSNWKNLGLQAKQKEYEYFGMNHLENPVIQARVCTGCHIGAPADDARGIPLRDANHDIMAAGHPRLIFEAASYSQNLPPHWNQGKYSADPDRDGKVWAFGQLVTAWASARLSKYRSAESSPVWPEFGEGDCNSCHADLQANSWRRSNAYYSGRKPGSIPGNSWHLALLPDALSVLDKMETPVIPSLASLQELISRNRSTQAQVHHAAVVAFENLDQLVTKLAESPDFPRKDWRLVLGKSLESKNYQHASWDLSTQASLAMAVLAPLGVALPDGLWEKLSFPPNYESPKGYKPIPKAFEDWFKTIEKKP